MTDDKFAKLWRSQENLFNDEFDKVWRCEDPDYHLIDEFTENAYYLCRVFKNKDKQYIKFRKYVDDFCQIRNREILGVIPEEIKTIVWREKPLEVREEWVEELREEEWTRRN